MSRQKTDFIFFILRSKYCSWWDKRVGNADLLASERAVWSEALAPYSLKQVKAAGYRCRERWQYRPPYAHEFTAFMDELAGRPIDHVTGKRFDPPEHSVFSKRFFEDFKAVFDK